MADYSFAECLKNAYKVNWRISDVLGDGLFDTTARWLPDGLSAAHPSLQCLDADELRCLNHVEMAAYAHLFGYVEEFIAPKVAQLALDYELEQRDAFDALTNFASEEVKHMTLFRKIRERVDATLGFELELLGGQKETARFVLEKSTGATLLLTAAIEWLTQRHYLETFESDDTLDARMKYIYKAHWLEESQHAKMDHLETLRFFASATDEEKDRAIDELIELVAAVDGLLQTQTEHDIRNLGRYIGRTFDAAETAELREAILRAKRWTFIQSGVTHARFEQLFAEVATPEQQQRVGAALEALFAPAAKVA